MSEEVSVKRGVERSADLDLDLQRVIRANDSAMSEISERGGGEDWDAPLDLRVARPRAVDLRALWKAAGATEPVQLAGALGSPRPVLLTHVVTPFPVDGRPPANVWGLGYEMIAHDIDADTVAVVPSTEVYKIAQLGHRLVFGIDAGGSFSLSDVGAVEAFAVRASTSARYQFEASFTVTLRKVIGAPVGNGGAQWKLFRQNERLDQPHTLYQLLLVPEDARGLHCTVKTWAKQAGRLGTGWGAKFWPYEDQTFTVKFA